MNRSAVARTEQLLLTDQMEKAAACKPASVAAQIILHRREGQATKDAAVNMLHMDAVQTTVRPPEAMRMKVVDVNMRASVAALINSRPLLDPNLKDAHAIHSNLDAAQTVLPFHKGHTTTVAIARRPNSNAAQTELPRQKDPKDQKVVLVHRVNTAVVWTVLHPLRDHDSKDAIVCRQHRRRRVASRKTVAIAPTTQLSTSSTLNTVAVRDSGTAVAAVMKIVSKLLRTVRALARSQLARALAPCRRSMDHALDIIQCITTILTAIPVHNSSSVAAWATIIASKQLRHARNFVSLTNPFVSSKSNENKNTDLILLLFASAICEQTVEEGPCEGNFERWYFDKDQDTCRPFRYGGCKGNKNNFPTEHACKYQCKKPGVRKGMFHVDVDNINRIHWFWTH